MATSIHFKAYYLLHSPQIAQNKMDQLSQELSL